jgi:hypothetical protein
VVFFSHVRPLAYQSYTDIDNFTNKQRRTKKSITNMKFKLNANAFRRLKALFHLYFIQINFENGDKNGVFLTVQYRSLRGVASSSASSNSKYINRAQKNRSYTSLLHYTDFQKVGLC